MLKTNTYFFSTFAITRGLFLLPASLHAQASAVPDRPDYNFHVRPILSDRCFFCHGTDSENRKAGLRLDTREGALAELKSGLRAIVPGDATKSELVKRIHATDPDETMPPPSAKISLTNDEKQILERWISQGAEYKTHWAFVPPAPQPPAAVSGALGEAKTPIDKYVLAALKQRGMDFQKPASKHRLLRRLSLDLTGLPPKPAEVDAFVADPDADGKAVERVVDRLLASPSFGERMAQDWMDVARFADTFGYQADATMHTWPWRDWVIEAFNKGLPFDQFITWQLAGDLLPEPSREQLVATAFNRLHRQTNEGGSVEEEFRVEYVSDRVQTFGLAFLGLTLECAKCHDHKYDPVTAKDFYSLSAFFANIDESGLYSHFTSATPTPALKLTDAERDKNIAAAKVAVAEAEQKVAEARDGSGPTEEAFQKWRTLDGKVDLSAGLVAHYAFESMDKQGVTNLVDAKSPAKPADTPELQEGKEGKALLLSGDNNVSFAPGGNWTRNDAFSFSFWMHTPDVKERAVLLHRSKAWTDAASCGYELLLEDGALSAALIHFWPGNALRVVAEKPVPTKQWCHVTWTYDGSSRASGVALYMDGERLPVKVVRDGLTGDINKGGEDSVAVGQRFRDRGFKNGSIDELRVYQRIVSPVEAALLAGKQPAQDEAALREYFWNAKSSGLRAVEAELKQARQKRSDLVDKVQELMIMKELPEPRTTYLLKRGSYEMRDAKVQPDVPTAVMSYPADAPKNRLGLAKWLLSDQQPLASRVLVNRFWQGLWGRGIVSTPEDFGLQGALPSHPELLDYLAVRFRENGWNLKALLKEMVLTQVYQQDSSAPEAVRAQDPENVFLGRGPKVKLSAEIIRDQALAAADLLQAKLGGPSVDPDTTNRRTLYTFWKRTMPDVRMEIFDMAKREVCIAKRQVTNTPLQALALLNEPKFVAAADAAAKIVEKDHGQDPPTAIRHLFVRMLGRPPSPAEFAVVQTHFQEQGGNLREVASLLMNHDEFVMKH